MKAIGANRWRAVAALLVLAGLAAPAGCGEERTIAWDQVETSIVVKITDGQLGAAATPMDISATGLHLKMDLEVKSGGAAGTLSEPGFIRLTARPGTVTLDDATHGGLVPVTGGVAKDVGLTVAGAFGETHVWAAFFREVPTDLDVDGLTYGVSDAIYFKNPSISQMQGTAVCSPMDGEYVVIDNGDVVVTSVNTSGMLVTDVSGLDSTRHAAPGSSVYVYSYNRPMSIPVCTQDEQDITGGCDFLDPIPVEICDRVKRLAGGISEFYGYTEMGFPTWTHVPWNPKKDGPCAVPEPTDVTCTQLLDQKAMFALEGSLVRVRNVAVDCQKGIDTCGTDTKYVKYGEWYVDLPSGANCPHPKMFIVTQDAMPDFNPFDVANYPNKDYKISSITGTLSVLYYAPSAANPCGVGGDATWLISPRCVDDVVISGDPKDIQKSCLPEDRQ